MNNTTTCVIAQVRRAGPHLGLQAYHSAWENQTESAGFDIQGPCIMICSYTKTNEIH